MRRLNRTVLSGGVMYPAGQPATPELEAQVTNQDFWEDTEAQYAAVTPVEPLVADPGPVGAPDPDPKDPPADPPADPPSLPATEPVDYSSWSYDQLVGEVKARNEQRDEDHHVKVASRKAEDLVAALTADDEAYA